MEYAIGIEIGGTKISACLVNDNGVVLEGKRTLTDADEGKAKVLSNMTKCIDELMQNKVKISGIGIGIAGFADQKGKIVFMPNVPLDGLNIGDYVKKKYKIPVYVENDASAFALGEYCFGGYDSKMLLGIIVGTGIGAGIVYDGKIIRGCMGCAGEIGHILLDNNAKQLEVKKNDFESACSGPNIEKKYVEATGKRLNGKGVFSSADSAAKKIVAEEHEILGRLLGSMVNTFNPDTIVLGGGVSKSLDPKLLKKNINRFAIPFSAKLVTVRHTKLDELGGVLGAAALVFRNEE